MATMTKRKPVSTRVDERGRVILPAALRKALALEPGDTLFVRQIGDRLELAKPENPFDGLARHAIKEDDAGRTIDLEEWAEREGVSLDDE